MTVERRLLSSALAGRTCEWVGTVALGGVAPDFARRELFFLLSISRQIRLPRTPAQQNSRASISLDNESTVYAQTSGCEVIPVPGSLDSLHSLQTPLACPMNLMTASH